MPKRLFIPLIIGLLCLPFLTFAQAETEISIGDTVDGELTAENLSAQYILSGNPGDEVTITLTSDDFDAFLTLLDPDGDELASDDDSGGGTNPQIADLTLEESGAYIILVDSYNRLATGAYTLAVEGEAAPFVPTLVPTPTAAPDLTPIVTTDTELKFGDTAQGSITASQDGVAYTFEGSAGQLVTITLTSADFDAYVVLQDASGSQLAADDDSAGNLNSRIEDFELPQDGTYTIVAGSYGSGASGNFSLTLETDDIGSLPTPEPGTPTPEPTLDATVEVLATDGGPITIGSSASGTIAPNQVSIAYTFEGTAGETVTITQSSTAFDSFVSLRNSDGDILAEDDDSAGNRNAQIANFTLPADDTYTIVVSSLGGFGSGGYLLQLDAGEGGIEATVEALTSDGGPYELGTTVNGTLDGAPALFTFEGGSGQIMQITLESNDFDPYLRLLNSAGDEVAADDDSAGNLNARISGFALPEADTYTIEVMGASGAASGNFTLSSAIGAIEPTAEPTTEPTVEPTAEPTISAPGTLSVGESVTSVLTGDGPNAYTFEGQTGDVVTITALSSDFDTYLRLLDSSGTELISDDDSAGNLNAAILNFRLPADDTYTILVSGFDDTATGEYSLALEGDAGTVEPTVEPTLEPTREPTGTDLTLGDSVTGTLTGDSLSVNYTFQGEAGQIIDITLTSDDFDTFLRLYDEDGDELISDDDSAGDLDSRIGLFQLPENGVYIISVESYDDETGEYTLSLSATEIAGIEYESAVNGSLDAGSTAGYRFSGEAGDVITISLHSAEFDTYLALNESGGDGFPLIEDDDSGGGTDSLIGPYTLPESGDYVIIVRSYDSSEGGNFRLSLNRATLTSIDFDQPVVANFDGEAGAQYYSFEGTTGDVISIRVDSQGTIDTSISVNGPDNFQLAYDDDSGADFDPEISRLILTQDGTYTILLQPFTTGDTGEAELTLIRAEIRSLDEGTQEVQLSEKLTQEVLSFTGTAGETVRLTVQVVSNTASAPSITVTQAGETIATATASSTGALSFEFDVPADGEVHIQISDYNFTKVVLAVTLERAAE